MKDQKPALPINVKHKYYVDERASKPYFIYRVADVVAVKKWKIIVDNIKNEKTFYPFLLQGFFAGEGSLKFHFPSKSRTLRISQGEPNQLIEDILNDMKINFNYNNNHRSYEIIGRNNLEKLKSINISIMHDQKHKKFLNMINSYQQYHYKKRFLETEVYNILSKPFMTNELAKIFNRSSARLTQTLVKLKRENKIINYRVRSRNYWLRKDQNLIVISKRKEQFLECLNKPRMTFHVANILNINWKAASKRLKELEKLNLVSQNNRGYWSKKKCKKKIMVL